MIIYRTLRSGPRGPRWPEMFRGRDHFLFSPFSHNAPCFPPLLTSTLKFSMTHCFQFPLGITVVPKRILRQWLCKIGGWGDGGGRGVNKKLHRELGPNSSPQNDPRVQLDQTPNQPLPKPEFLQACRHTSERRHSLWGYYKKELLKDITLFFLYNCRIAVEHTRKRRDGKHLAKDLLTLRYSSPRGMLGPWLPKLRVMVLRRHA